MRIIAGRFKGRRLQTPTWDGLRPTSDKLRETLFDVLARRIVDAKVLDGFAGTGAIGLEALSRGAAAVTFVESDRRAAALIRTNTDVCGPGGRYTIECGDVIAVLRRLAPGARFDLILLDPPYAFPLVSEVLAAAAGRLASDGMMVLERATRNEPDVPLSLERVRDLRSGDSTLTLLTHRGGAEAPLEKR